MYGGKPLPHTMSTCNIVMLTCDILVYVNMNISMLTCNIIISTCEILHVEVKIMPPYKYMNHVCEYPIIFIYFYDGESSRFNTSAAYMQDTS